MFSPSQTDVRRFFCQTALKLRQASGMDAIETLAAMWIAEHPEYEAALGDEADAVDRNYAVDDAKTNPFLHLSMHLSISEQCSIDQPRGIRQAVELLTARCGDLHEAHHQVMECLGDMLWQSQRDQTPPDGDRYIEAVQRRATQD